MTGRRVVITSTAPALYDPSLEAPGALALRGGCDLDLGAPSARALVCTWCGEPLDEMLQDLGPAGQSGGVPIDRDCLLRMIVGGVNHQLGRCSCCGGPEPPDPVGMTRREAAKAAADHFRARIAGAREVAP